MCSVAGESGKNELTSSFILGYRYIGIRVICQDDPRSFCARWIRVARKVALLRYAYAPHEVGIAWIRTDRIERGETNVIDQFFVFLGVRFFKVREGLLSVPDKGVRTGQGRQPASLGCSSQHMREVALCIRAERTPCRSEFLQFTDGFCEASCHGVQLR